MQHNALLTASLLATLASSANAGPVYVTGDGSAVTSLDRYASFDSLDVGDDLSGYTEDGINVFVNDVYGQFPGSYFGSQGYDAGSVTDSLYNISASDGATFYAAELLLQDWGYTATGWDTFVWETWLNGALTGSGTFTTPADLTIMGWFDADGMDQLRVGSFNGTNNGLWFDDLEIQTSTIPEPATLVLFGIGLAGAGLARRRKKV